MTKPIPSNWREVACGSEPICKWAQIGPAKRLAIRVLTFSVPMHLNVREETYLDSSEARKPRKGLLGETTFYISAGAFKLDKEQREQ